MTAPALPGRGPAADIDPRLSRRVKAPDAAGIPREWHVLDNAVVLAERGVTPVGTLLCVHGNPTWSYLWRELVGAASDAAWRVVAPDQLEMGFSERTGIRRDLVTRGNDLAHLVDALGIDGPVVTVGHDWGGVISLGWAVEHRSRLGGVILLNTAVHQPGQAPVPALLRLALARPLRVPATVCTPAFLEAALGLAREPLAPATLAAYRAPYRTAKRRRGIGQFVADIPVDERHPSRAILDRIAEQVRSLQVPALMLWGPRDPVFGDRYLDDLLERMPHADVHRFERAGHLLAEDVAFAPAVLTWLADQVLPRLDSTPVAPERPQGASRSPGAPHPLWHYLDELAQSSLPALIEMAPRGSARANSSSVRQRGTRPSLGKRQHPREISWRLLSRRVRELSAGLLAHGVRPGDRVSVLVPAGADLTAVLYSCLRIGAVVVVADAGLGVHGLSRAVRGARPDHIIGIDRALIAATALGWPGQRISTRRLPRPAARALGVGASLADLAASGRQALIATPLPPQPDPDAQAAILFTSGSTGPAKGVVYTHRQLSALAATVAAEYEVTPGTGLVAGFAPFALLGPALGAASVTPDMDVTAPGSLTAAALADAAAAVDARIVFASPAALTSVYGTRSRLTRHQRAALDRVQTLLSAGAPLSAALLERVATTFPAARIHTPYGMTEALLVTDITLDELREVGGGDGVCVGRPTGPSRVLISPLDRHGTASGDPTAAPGITGEILVSAPHIKDHYYRLWLTQHESVRDTPAGERWHRTGDVGHLDVSGRLWVEGRLHHVVVTAAGVLTPVGPEQRVEQVPGLGRAALVGIGPAGTQQPVIVAEAVPPVRMPRLAPAELTARVREAAAVPVTASADAVQVAAVPVAAVLLVPELPTDIRHNSKIDRTRLAAWAASVLAGERLGRP
ncbi:alpha/beta fold hydrolase [Diaminobutyricimonas sp. LJ205]|uniref:alpha/beta fold hydrolase n=1 Tax=Diaminobutyricimonas sp. LJ205 TaxID=2683590 RepID=UPI001E3CAC67|nr:alpha/beta fold hydrolase [Diaminobutyricimonas sp. LJ205]